MPQSVAFPATSALRELEGARDSRVLVLCASHLDMELLPALYAQLNDMGRQRRLDVVLQARGGEINAVRRMALLLRRFSDHLAFIVPYHCQSSGTILALAGDEIIAGDLALFSPIDPHLHGSAGQGESSAMSCEDIRQFGEMSRDWFGVDPDEARAQSLSLLCQSIFPPTLTAFYRSTLELKQIGRELLGSQLPGADRERLDGIVAALMFGYHSHDYAITGDELHALGLNIRRHEEVERLAWELSLCLQGIVGGGQRSADDQPWHDALIAATRSLRVRTRTMEALNGQWHQETLPDA
ncbi:hypothetical protein [Gallaecimonas sp. GXIMD4217]|uniref:SDH family Clp fold serine proteinase n=1 Tax=Gallaecimonas sp. GXIMD4217 TaxID=3131927 RepID=UPI00311ABA68